MDFLTAFLASLGAVLLEGAKATTQVSLERGLNSKGELDLSTGTPQTVLVSLRLRMMSSGTMVKPHWVYVGLKSRGGPLLRVMLAHGEQLRVRIPAQPSGYDLYALFVDLPSSTSDKPVIRAAILNDHILPVGKKALKYHETVGPLRYVDRIELERTITENDLHFSLPYILPPGQFQLLPGLFDISTGRFAPLGSGPEIPSSPTTRATTRPALPRPAEGSRNPNSTGSSHLLDGEPADTPLPPARDRARPALPPPSGKESGNPHRSGPPRSAEASRANDGYAAPERPKRKRRKAGPPLPEYISRERFAVELYNETPMSEEDFASLGLNIKGQWRSAYGYSSRGCMTYEASGRKCDHSPAHGFLLCKNHLFDLYDGMILAVVDSEDVFMR